jgi:hypothetical protein
MRLGFGLHPDARGAGSGSEYDDTHGDPFPAPHQGIVRQMGRGGSWPAISA